MKTPTIVIRKPEAATDYILNNHFINNKLVIIIYLLKVDHRKYSTKIIIYKFSYKYMDNLSQRYAGILK